jgi:hypothetical protein
VLNAGKLAHPKKEDEEKKEERENELTEEKA